MTGAHTEQHALEVPPELDGARFDQALAQLLRQYSRTLLKGWIEAGAATLNARPARPRDRVHAGDRVAVTATLETDERLAPQAVPYAVVFADDDLIVIDKPAGLVVHPGAGNRDHTLVNGLVAAWPELGRLPRAGLVHRIDKDTSGLLLVARRPASFQALVRAMAARRVERTYHAVVRGVLVAGGTIEAPIRRDPRQRTRMAVGEGGRAAVTHYRVLERYRAHTLLEVHLETGRTHQIRVHMAWRGHALVGDPVYGGRARAVAGATPALAAALAGFQRQALHATALAFDHPADGRRLGFTSAHPADFAALLVALGQDLAAASA
ncbi:MAG: 23S rRNA pseudouridine(1911/1915/1917) synthase RluD [Gammaproteobacteria bacterium]|nr:23S rRNA pseudouridine(1911/1915/1917) synthase RluD [Gammaproteobacteria bacterium]